MSRNLEVGTIRSGEDYMISIHSYRKPVENRPIQGFSVLPKGFANIAMHNRSHVRGDQVSFGSRTGLESVLNESLCKAAEAGNLPLIQKLLRNKHLDINHAIPYTGKTALMLAAENNKPEILRLLARQRGIKLEKCDYDQRTALMLAAKKGFIPGMKILLAAGARKHSVDRVGMNALLIAVNNNQIETVLYLLDQNLPIESTDYVGRTPLLLAAERGHTDIIRKLLNIQRPANLEAQNFEGMTPLMMACREGRLQAADELIHAGALINSTNRLGFTPLMLAAREGHTDLVKTLLANGAFVNLQSNAWDSALLLAAENNHADIVERLLSKGADAGQIHREGYTALIQAARLGYQETVNALLQKPDEVLINHADRHGLTALGYAIDRKDPQVVSTLLGINGIDIEQPDNAGNTPLLLAARRNSMPVLELLLDRNVNIQHANRRGETALHYAAQQGNLPMVKRLVKLGANLNAVNIDGATPLLLAAQGGHNKLADWMIQQEGDLQRPYNRQYQQFQNYMDAVAKTAHLDRGQGYPQLLTELAKRNDFKLAEQFLLADGKSLNYMPWVLRNEMAWFTSTPPLPKSGDTADIKDDMREQHQARRDGAWHNIKFLTRKNVDFTPAGIEMAMRYLERQKQPMATQNLEKELAELVAMLSAEGLPSSIEQSDS